MTITLDKCFFLPSGMDNNKAGCPAQPWQSDLQCVGDVEKNLFSCEQNPCVFCVWKSFQLQ